jgi:hypothetical protein
MDLESMDSLMAIVLRKMISRLTMGSKYYDGEDDFEIGNLSGNMKLKATVPNCTTRRKLKMLYSGQEKLFSNQILPEYPCPSF